MKRIRILLIALMIALFLPAQVRSDDPASVSPEFPSAASQDGGDSRENTGRDSAGGSALFGVLILAPAATEAPEQPVQAELILDFSAYDPALDQEDPLVRYDIENEQVTVDFLRVLRQELSGEARVEQSGALSDEDREKLTALAERYQEEQKNEQTEQTASLRLEQNLLILTGDGELTLSDGENSLRLEVKGSDALLTRHMARDDVQVDVVEGFVPAGSGLSYEALDADEAESLAQLYLSFGGLRKDETLPAADTGKKLMNPGPKKTASLRQVSPAGASATGYSAFELSIVRDNQPVGGSGEYAVTLPLPAEAANLVPRGARQKNISYTLYHVHGETVDQLDVRAEGDVLCFTTPNFSTFILQYTVDFEYVDPETGELYAYTLPGGEETPLSALLSALSVEADLTGSEAIFSDPSLIELTPVSGEDGTVTDWNLRSLMPFDSEEQLTVTLRNGAEVILRVTDEQIATRVMDAKGDTYEITVTYGRDARIPYDAKLQAREILPDDDAFQSYLDQAGAALDSELEREDIRLFDIAIVSGDEKVTLEAPVQVDISFVPMEHSPGAELNLLHFADDDTAPVRVEDFSFVTAEEEVSGVSFTADGFSVYAVTSSIWKDIVIGGETYRITVTYDKSACIPDGAVLDAKEVSAEGYLEQTAAVLGWNENDDVFYAKYLDISILYNGEEIEPKSPVHVTVELLDVTDGAEALEVVHFGEEGAQKIGSSADENGTVTFSSDSFSVFGFGSILRTLVSWTENLVSYKLQSFSTLLNPTYEAVTVEPEEGLEAVSAYNVSSEKIENSQLGSLVNALYVRVSSALELGARESVAVYSLKDGKIDEILTGGTNADSSLALGGSDGFALVKDSGFRRKVFELGAVELDGMMPKAAEAQAVDVTESYADFDFSGSSAETAQEDNSSSEAVTDEEDVLSAEAPEEPSSKVIAAYEISITDGADKYQPDQEHPVLVEISSDAITTDGYFSLWHIQDDGSIEQVTDFAVEEGKVSFTAAGFSVYVVIEHEGGTVVTPRVIFHFISNGAAEHTQDSAVYYEGSPYEFRNKNTDTQNNIQTTQILTDGESLEYIADPDNAGTNYFYGWYVVNPYVISGTTDDYGIGTAGSKLYYTWPANPDRISFENPITITGSNVSIGDTVDWSLNGVTGSGTVDENGNVHAFLAPLFEKYHFVNFMLRSRTQSGSNNLMTRRMVALGGASSAEVKISDIRSTSTDPVHLVFTGWEYYDTATSAWITKQTVDYSGAVLQDPGKDGVYVSVAGDVDLYPVFVEARWVDFTAGVSGSGATYVASRFLESWGRATEEHPPEDTPGRNVFTSLSTSSRTGYGFDGWYAFARTDPNTGEITNLQNPADVEISYLTIDGEGGYVAHTVTVNTTAVKITNADGTVYNCGTWSVTDDGTLRNNDSGYKLFDASGGKLRFFDSLDRLMLYAKWAPAISQITVIYWTENAQDKNYSAPQEEKDDYTASAVKVITTDELNSQSGTIGATFASGSTLTLSQLGLYQDNSAGVLDRTYLDDIGAVPSGEEKFYDRNDSLSDASVVIKGDGSTTVNVYFSRKVFKLVFHIGRDGYVKNGGHQKTDAGWDGNWIEFMYKDAKVTELGYPKEGGGRDPAVSIQGVFSMTYLPTNAKYTSEYVTTNANVMGDYDPVSDTNLYVLAAKYGAYIGDRWPTPTNPNFRFTDAPGKGKTMYIWAAYYGSLYCRIANERSTAGNPQGANPDINGVYEYMSAELCSNRAGDDIINNNQVHHLVAYYGNTSNEKRYKQYHILFEAIPGTYDPAQSTVPGEDYEAYRLTTWSQEHTVGDKSEILRHFFIESANSPKPIISNLEPQFQLTDTLDGYEQVYSCYDPVQHPNNDNPSQNDYHIYFFYRPRQYTVTFNFGSTTKSDIYYYKQALADADKYTDEVTVPEGYYFRGWYTNAEGFGDPFDFANETMPSQNVVLYPVLGALQYTVKIDPNGGVIDHRANASTSTYFNAYYGIPVGEYGTERTFISLTEKEQTPGDPNYYSGTKYYYINTQRLGISSEGDWGLPTELRNAVYVAEDKLDTYYNWYASVIDNADLSYWSGISKLSRDAFIHTYTSGPCRPLAGGEHYSFMGWYQVFEDGSVASMPYNFNDPLTGPLELRAKWRLDGGYYIQYNPYYFDETGGSITAIIGEIQEWTDPANPGQQLYADQSPTHILNAPTNVTSGWIFRGWRVVRANGTRTYTDGSGERTYINWEPFGDSNYYQPGDAFTVDSALVTEITSTGKAIHMQAYYEPEDSSYRRPDITNLTLDANDEYGGYVNSTDLTSLPALNGPGSLAINTTDHLSGGNPTQILFGDFQSNLALHLYRYATSKTFDNVQGTNFFTNSNGHLLIGFDENSDPESPTTGKPYIPAFAPDSVAAVTRDDDRMLYAMWEPMLYVTFVNTTDEDITIELSGSGTSTVNVVNAVTGEFDREQKTTTITVPAKSGTVNGKIKIVLPEAEAGTDSFTATAVNDHIRKKMSVSGEFRDSSPYGTGSGPNKYGSNVTYTGVLQTDATGIIVTYTEEPDQELVFDVNGGTWTETSEDYKYLSGDVYSINEDKIVNNAYRPSDPTRTSYIFLGWTINEDIAGQTDFSSTTAVTWGGTTITPDAGSNVLEKIKSDFLWDFTQEPPYSRTLYAVWSEPVTVTFDIVRTGSSLHVWKGPDTTSVPAPYEFYRSSDTSGAITYTLAKGDRVPRPEEPTADPTTTNWYFIKWLLNKTNYRNTTKAVTEAAIQNNAYDFSQFVMNNITLSTSWTTIQPQFFTFTVENRVEGGNADDEFVYTVGVSNELVRGKLGTSGQNSNGVPDRRWGSVTTALKNNQKYTVDVKVTSASATSFSVEITVTDREGIVIKSGHVIYCNKNGISPYFVSDFMYTLTVTQEEKTGYTTTVHEDDETPENSIDSGTDDASRTFTFYSCICTTSNQTGTFRPLANGYVAGASNSLTVVFANTGALYVAPTGLSLNHLPYILLLAAGTALITVAIAGLRRKKEED